MKYLNIAKVFLRKNWHILSALGGLLVGLDSMLSNWQQTSKTAKEILLGTDNNEKSTIKVFNQYTADSLFVLVIKFEGYQSSIDTQIFGQSIKDRINDFSAKYKLPIIAKYLDLSPENIPLIRNIISSSNADIAIWGRAKNILDNCSEADICFKMSASDSLIKNVGEKIEVNNSLYRRTTPMMMEIGDYTVDSTRFDSWIISIYNAKVGKSNPNLYAIDMSLSKPLIAKQFFEQARLFQSLKQEGIACNLFEKAYEADSTNTGVAFFLGICELQSGNHTLAIEHLTKSIELVPGQRLAYIPRSFARLLIGDYRGSVEDMNEAIKDYPKVAEYYYSRALSYSYSNNNSAAINDLSTAISMDSLSPKFLTLRGQILMKNNNIPLAILDLKKALKIDVKYLLARRDLSKAYAKQKNYVDAISEYHQIMRFDPSDSSAYLDCGNLYFSLKKYKDAEREYTKGIASLPKCATLLFERSIARYYLKNQSASLSDINKAITINKKNPIFYNARAEIHALDDDKLKAIDDYNVSEKLNSKQKYIYLNRAWLEVDTKDYAGAYKDATRSIQINNRKTDGYYIRGLCRQAIGDSLGAIKEFRNAINEYSNNLDAIFAIAKISNNLRRFGEALYYYKMYSTLSPSAQAYLNVAICLKNLGRYEESISYCERSLAIESLNEDTYFTLANIYGNLGLVYKEYSNRIVARIIYGVKFNKAKTVLYCVLSFFAIVVLSVIKTKITEKAHKSSDHPI